jgi:hypothetical protein
MQLDTRLHCEYVVGTSDRAWQFTEVEAGGAWSDAEVGEPGWHVGQVACGHWYSGIYTPQSCRDIKTYQARALGSIERIQL